jgi:hypothetical protein
MTNFIPRRIGVRGASSADAAGRRAVAFAAVPVFRAVVLVAALVVAFFVVVRAGAFAFVTPAAFGVVRVAPVARLVAARGVARRGVAVAPTPSFVSFSDINPTLWCALPIAVCGAANS